MAVANVRTTVGRPFPLLERYQAARDLANLARDLSADKRVAGGTFDLRIENPGRVFRPGERLAVRATWSVPFDPLAVGIRLGWMTQGKGDRDTSVVSEVSLAPDKSGDGRVEFILPDGPLSFSGKFVSLAWYVELRLSESGLFLLHNVDVRLEFDLSTGSEPIRLAEILA